MVVAVLVALAVLDWSVLLVQLDQRQPLDWSALMDRIQEKLERERPVGEREREWVQA